MRKVAGVGAADEREIWNRVAIDERVAFAGEHFHRRGGGADVLGVAAVSREPAAEAGSPVGADDVGVEREWFSDRIDDQRVEQTKRMAWRPERADADRARHDVGPQPRE